MVDAGSDALIHALRDIAKKSKLIPPELIVTLSKRGQQFLQILSDENALPNDILRQSGLFCGEVFNEKSGKNLDRQDENTLALWMIGTLINELFDVEKIKNVDLLIAQKEKILDLLEKEPFFAKAMEVPMSSVVQVVEITEELVEVMPSTVKDKIVEVPEIKPAEKIEPIVVPVSMPVKESIADRLEKVRAEITEKAKSMSLDKIKNEIEENAKTSFSAFKNLFRRK